ncbi:MAG: phage adaptor protein [Hyphomicrobium sp.]
MFADLQALKNAITSELARNDTDVVSRLGTFVALADLRMFEGDEPLRAREMETRATVAFTNGTATLPANFLEARRVTWQGDIPSNLVYREPGDFYASVVVGGGGPYIPNLFSIEGQTIDVLPRATGNATVSYYARPAALVADVDTNTVLTAHGAIYLFAALIEAYLYLRNTAKAAESVDRYLSALRGVNATARRARYAGTRLAPRVVGAYAR